MAEYKKLMMIQNVSLGDINDLGGTLTPNSFSMIYRSFRFYSLYKEVLKARVNDGTVVVFDIGSNQLSMEDAIFSIDTEGTIYGNMTFLSIDDIVVWNREVGNEMINIIRADCIKIGLANVGTDAYTLLSKTSSLIVMLVAGMLEETALVASQMENDGFFTPERMQRYIGMLLASFADKPDLAV